MMMMIVIMNVVVIMIVMVSAPLTGSEYYGIRIGPASACIAHFLFSLFNSD